MTPRRAAGLLLALLGLACALWPAMAGQVLLQGRASRAAAQRVDVALERCQDTFLTLSAAKAGLAVVEGSSLGVGFDLQIGDLVQPVFDLLDFFWRLFLFAFLLLGAYKLLMETGILGLGMALLGAAGVLLGAAEWLPRSRERLQTAARLAALAGLVVAYLLPISLLATHALAEIYFRPLAERYRLQVDGFVDELEEARRWVLDPEAAPPWWQPGERVADFRERVSAAAQHIARGFDAALPSLSLYAVLVLFDHLVLPFTAAYLLLRLAGLALGSWLPAPGRR